MDLAEKKILNNYLGLLKGLDRDMKLNLIEGLTASTKSHTPSKSKIKSSFGAWNSKESAEQLIESVHSSRNTDRHIEKF